MRGLAAAVAAFANGMLFLCAPTGARAQSAQQTPAPTAVPQSTVAPSETVASQAATPRVQASTPPAAASPVETANGTPAPTKTPSQSKLEDLNPAPRPERKPWRLTVEGAKVTWRAPLTQTFAPLPADSEVPENSVLQIRIPVGRKGRVRAVHAGGSTLEITTTTLLRLVSSELAPGTRPFRIALEDLPSNLESEETEEKESGLDRIVSFFLPRVPLGQGDIPKRVAQKPWARNPIRPAYPGQVHLVESEELPVVVNFEWPVQGGQVEPHSFYLWMEERFVQAPHAIVRGGRISLELSDYGKYFWQVEDKPGQFVSSPRVIYVRRPGETLEGGKLQAPASPAPGQAEDDSRGMFQLKSPRKKSVVAVCLGKEGGPPPRIPVLVPNAVRNAKRYIVRTDPPLAMGQGDGVLSFERTDDRLFFEGDVPVTSLGNVTFSLKAVVIDKDGQELEVVGDSTPVRVTDVCSAAKGLTGHSAFADYLARTSREPLPESGAMVLLHEGTSP